MINLLNRHVAQPLMALRSGSRHLEYLKVLRDGSSTSLL